MTKQGERNMTTMTLTEPLQHILQEFTITNPLDIIKEYLITEILCKISDFTRQQYENLQYS